MRCAVVLALSLCTLCVVAWLPHTVSAVATRRSTLAAGAGVLQASEAESAMTSESESGVNGLPLPGQACNRGRGVCTAQPQWCAPGTQPVPNLCTGQGGRGWGFCCVGGGGGHAPPPPPPRQAQWPTQQAQWPTQPQRAAPPIAPAGGTALCPGKIVAMPARGVFQSKAGHVVAALMRDFNLTPAQSASIVGNWGVECPGLQPQNERTCSGAGVNPNVARCGFGWAQWTNSRRVNFFQFVNSRRMDPFSEQSNYAFAVHELSTAYGGLLAQLRAKGNDVAQLTCWWMQKYEIPKDRQQNRAQAGQDALAAYFALVGGRH